MYQAQGVQTGPERHSVIARLLGAVGLPIFIVYTIGKGWTIFESLEGARGPGGHGVWGSSRG